MKRFLVLFLAVVLSSCGKGSTPAAGEQAAAFAYVRVVNGSPDIETIDPKLPPTAPACDFGSAVGGIGTLISAEINGVQAAASFPYEAISQYVAVGPGPASVAIVAPGGLQTGCPSISFTTPALQANSYQTVVLSGAYVKKTLKFIVFADPAPSSSPAARINNASPLAGTTGFGTFVPGTAVYTNAGSVSVGASAPAPSASAAPGLGYYAGSVSSPSVTIQPSQIDTNDLNNVLPFGAYGHLSIFIIDPPIGGSVPQLVGGFY